MRSVVEGKRTPKSAAHQRRRTQVAVLRRVGETLARRIGMGMLRLHSSRRDELRIQISVERTAALGSTRRSHGVRGRWFPCRVREHSTAPPQQGRGPGPVRTKRRAQLREVIPDILRHPWGRHGGSLAPFPIHCNLVSFLQRMDELDGRRDLCNLSKCI